ncbi:hypothetical protein DICPUDRAFT_74709 [Dictyostelium purpureum]|uniref:FNIP repeat-containing protein n=1 Tax=Dictyostelium purpureum TaxID=5786 RepID=F0Z8I6_DICPU|nr:uncharacterized protein DICPUDRAFT_74709 [Dictyostelium purpureum]EGC39765.1 hypothetical protein DICPUDRAFT_74709 [Dictyostelium purpureum]|eukprot:XP_003283751.1 hypothetical protein DICPUDRAFT_74709 [Dictyostelium purpureum]
MDNSHLFFLIWRNIYLNSKIFKELRIHKVIGDCSVEFETLDSFNSFKNKEYLNDITISFNNENLESIIPRNVKEIGFNGMRKSFSNVPSWVESVHINTLFKWSIISTAKNLKTLFVHSEIIKEIHSNTIPQSVTDLSLHLYKYRLKGDLLPKNLESLSIQPISKVFFEDNIIFPSTLKRLKIGMSVPSFETKVNLPAGLELLSILGSIIISESYIFPQSLEDLKFRTVELYTPLPNSLKKLSLYVATKIGESVLPPNLEHMGLITGIEMDPKIIPKKLKTLQTNISSLVDWNGASILPDTLVNLIFCNDGPSGFNQKLTPNIFPNSLVYLSFATNSGKLKYFNNGGAPLVEDGIFPSSLTYLNLGNAFNQKIGLGTLSHCAALKTLILGRHFDQELSPESLPKSLELLQINNPRYSHQVKASSPYTVIKCSNIDLYYDIHSSSPETIRVLALPENFNKPPKELNLVDKINLEYLDLGYAFNGELTLDSLPINNSIKTLVLSYGYNKIINLENFKQLEIIIINGSPGEILTTTIIENSDGSVSYNFYCLKEIQVNYDPSFLSQLNPIFYPFLRNAKKKYNPQFIIPHILT